jgi:hypothetical protein
MGCEFSKAVHPVNDLPLIDTSRLNPPRLIQQTLTSMTIIPSCGTTIKIKPSVKTINHGSILYDSGTQCDDLMYDRGLDDLMSTGRGQLEAGDQANESRVSVQADKENVMIRGAKQFFSPIEIRNHAQANFTSSPQFNSTPFISGIAKKREFVDKIEENCLRVDKKSLTMQREKHAHRPHKKTSLIPKGQPQPLKSQSNISLSSDGIEYENADPFVSQIDHDYRNNHKQHISGKNIDSKVSFADILEKDASQLNINPSLGHLSENTFKIKKPRLYREDGKPQAAKTISEVKYSSIGKMSFQDGFNYRGKAACSNLSKSMLGINMQAIRKQSMTPIIKDMNITISASILKAYAPDNSICFGDVEKYSEFYDRFKSQSYRQKGMPVNILDGLKRDDAMQNSSPGFGGRSIARKQSKSVREIKGDKVSDEYGILNKWKPVTKSRSTVLHRSVNPRFRKLTANISVNKFSIELQELKEDSSVDISNKRDSDQVSGVHREKCESHESSATAKIQVNDSVLSRTSQIHAAGLDSSKLIDKHNASLPTIHACRNYSGIIHEDQEDLYSSSQSEANIVPLKYKEVRAIYKKSTIQSKADLNSSVPCIKMTKFNNQKTTMRLPVKD